MGADNFGSSVVNDQIKVVIFIQEVVLVGLNNCAYPVEVRGFDFTGHEETIAPSVFP